MTDERSMRHIAWAIAGVAVVAIAAVALWIVRRPESRAAPEAGTPSGGVEIRVSVPDRNLLLFGLDGADWDLVDPLIESGELPNLARLVEGGTRARLRTIHPILSPVVWTSIATGKRPDKHGIFDFLATSADGSMVPVTSTLWEARSLWSILGDAGIPVAVTAWWATWPAEPVHGYMATDRISYQLFRDVLDAADRTDPAADSRGKSWPPELFDAIAPRILAPVSISDDDLATYVDLEALGRPDDDDAERLEELRTVIASAKTYEAIATMLLDLQPGGFHAVYNEATDTVAHVFMPFHFPAMQGIDHRLAAAFGGAVDAAYREADAMLGRLLSRVGPEWNVVVLSDHGFKHGDNRPSTDPRISHGPAADWHDRFGILVLHGPDIRRGVAVADATILDVAPTLLALFGLPVGDDMDGRVLVEALEPAFLESHPVERIPSWESDAPVPETAAIEPSPQDLELMEKLRALGYIAGGTADATGSTPSAASPDPAAFAQDNARAFNNRGIALLARGERDAAKEEFRKGLEAGGGVASLSNIARVHLSAMEVTQAEQVLDRIEQIDPGFRKLPALRGWLAELQNDREGAERWLREAIRLDPADSRSLARLGHLLEGRGAVSEAEARYRDAVRADPENAEAFNYLGNVLRADRRLAEAERAYRDAVAADPKYPGGYNNLGLILQESGRLDEAIALYRAGLEQAPESALLHNSLGSVLIVRGDLDGAEAAVRKALRTDPGLAEARSNLGIILAENGRIDEARVEFEAAVDARPEWSEAHFNLGRARLLLRDVAGAREAFARASDLRPDHLDAALGAGETAYRLRRDAQAIRYFERACDIAPDIARVRRELGELYLRNGDPARAADEWRESLRIEPDQPELRSRLKDLERR